MVLTESGWPFAIPTCFLAQGHGMLWCCEVVSAFLMSPGCCMQWCWCVQLVQPCCWVIDSAKHLSCLACPAAVSKQKKKKESCWVACTLPRCSSSRFWGWWNSLAKEQKSSLSEALLDMKHLGSYASDPYRTLKMFASCLVGLVGSEMSWVWYFVSNAKFLIKPQKKTSATLHLSSLLGKSWSLASKYLSKLPIWDALMTLLFLLCVSSCAPTLWRVVKGEGLTHGVVSWALWFISFYSYTELLVKV